MFKFAACPCTLDYFFLSLIIESYCFHMGMEYNIEDVIQPNCSARCTCQGGYWDCKPQRCSLDGPTCYGWGDPHYRSFDYRYFDFQGDCEYVLSKPCNGSDFIITVSNVAINSFVSATKAVTIVIPSKGLEIVLSRGGTITINGVVQVNNGDRVVHRSSGVEVLRTGGRPYILLNVGSPLSVFWDGWWRVEVTVSSGWQNKLCGLCGNYNNNDSDEFMLPGGFFTTSPEVFGTSWLYTNSSSSCGSQQIPPLCPQNLMNTAQSKCNTLLNSVFNVCNSVVDPTKFIDGCTLDYCQCSEEDREDCYCNSLSTYAAACASNGVVISNWRNTSCCKCLFIKTM